MSEICDFLIGHYYSKYKGTRTDVVPTIEQLQRGITNHPDKLVIIRDENIKGIGIFLRLSDKTFAELKSFDIQRVDILKGFLNETGSNIHFILLCADGYKTIMTGLNHVKRRYNPKTISWWNPDLTHLHVRRF